MKKIKKIALAVALCGAMTVSAVGSITASASTQTKNLVTDSFNNLDNAGGVDSSAWEVTKADGSSGVIAQQEASDSSLYLVSGISGGEQAMITTTRRFNDITSVQYDVKLESGENRYSNNLTFIQEDVLNEGMQHTLVNGLYVYQAAFLIRGECISTPENVSSLTVQEANATWHSLLGLENVEGLWLRVKVVPQDEATANIYIAVRDDANTQLPSEPTCSVSWSEGNEVRSFKEGYIGWATTTPGNGQYLDNIIIEADGVTLAEDFSIANGLKWDEKEQLQVIGPNKNEGGFVLYDESALELKNLIAGDRIISTKEVLADDSTVNNLLGFEVNFNAKFTASTISGDEIAFVFNLPSKTASPLDSCYAYVMTRTGGRLEKYVGGQKVSLQESNRNAFTGLRSERGSDIRITVNKNGEFTVYENGRRVQGTFDKIDGYTGYFGFTTLSACTGAVEIDNFIAYNRTYYVPVTKSVTHDFSNDFFGNDGYMDFYTSQIPENSLFVENGRLVMQGASDGTFFGSAHQYDSFIMDYTLCNVYVGTGDGLDYQETKPNRWLGLDLSRNTTTSPSYGSYGMLYFAIVPPAGATSVGLNLYTAENSVLDPSTVTVSQVKPIPAEYFTDISYDGVNKVKADVSEDDGLCVRWVSENGILKLYMKKFGETEFTLYYTVFGLELRGYFAICNTGYVHAELDNFSMANTSPKYECAPNEPPKERVEEVIVEIYDRGNLDVNWESELTFNPITATSPDSSGKSGCQSSAVGLPITLVLGAVAIIRIKRKG
ncbi:MAG: hypothetical protein IKA61_01405 [Clostridia bacterium]|nr:hypothetical protein [Clostridia bacterium]